MQNPEVANAVLNVSTPKEAKQIASQLKKKKLHVVGGMVQNQSVCDELCATR